MVNAYQSGYKKRRMPTKAILIEFKCHTTNMNKKIKSFSSFSIFISVGFWGFGEIGRAHV
jgi:hypothetical protein